MKVDQFLAVEHRPPVNSSSCAVGEDTKARLSDCGYHHRYHPVRRGQQPYGGLCAYKEHAPWRNKSLRQLKRKYQRAAMKKLVQRMAILTILMPIIPQQHPAYRTKDTLILLTQRRWKPAIDESITITAHRRDKTCLSHQHATRLKLSIPIF